MKKKIIMFIICIIFVLIISCNNDAIDKIDKDLKNSEQVVKGSKEIEQEVGNKFDKLLDTLNTLDIKDTNDLNTQEVEKTIQELKKAIDELKQTIGKTDPKKTPIGTYSEYEKKIQELEKKLKDKFKDKEKFGEKFKELEEKLKELEKTLKDKKENRKKVLEEAKKKFEEYKKQVESASGETYGAQVGNQRGGGQQAWKEAKELGLSVNSYDGADTSGLSSGIIDGAIKQIEEELKELDKD